MRAAAFGRRLVVLACALALLVAADALTSPADASPKTWETGVVTRVTDGDTFRIDVDGGSKGVTIRVAGLQAMETGECHAEAATKRLRALIEGKRVELRALDRAASSHGRPIRHVFVASSGVDATKVMLQEGMGLWFPLGQEISFSKSYQQAANAARAADKGMWKPEACGVGPSRDIPIRMWAKPDAEGYDTDNLNDEFVVIQNRHASKSLPLGGWVLRTSQPRLYSIPAGTSVPAGGRLTVRVGSGKDTATTKYIGDTYPWFRNASLTTFVGDGAYLFDPDGDVRALFMWPYVGTKRDPLAGAVYISKVMYDPPGVDTQDTEYLQLRNMSAKRQSLDGYYLRSAPYHHNFRPGTYLDPGERLTIVVGKGTSSRLKQYMGKTKPILRNAGGMIEVISFDERPVDCWAWGDKTCAPGAAPAGAYVACATTSHALVGDWEGTGRDGVGWWCDGRTRLRTATGKVHEFTYGRKGDVPVVADWNGDGRDTVSVIRDGTWHMNNRLGGGAAQGSFHYGRVTRGDRPMAGAWDGRSRDLPGIIRDREWHLRSSQTGGNATWAFIYGRLSRGDLPLWGDWNGDGRDTAGIVRDGTWHLRNHHAAGGADISYVFGRVKAGDVPVVGDWNGDGLDTPGIVRDGIWHLRTSHSSGPADIAVAFPSW